MNRSASAPSPPLQGRTKKDTPSLLSSKLQAGRKLAAGSGPLGRAGSKLILPTSVEGSYLLQGPDARARLPHFAPVELWEKHSSKHIVRELYAGYAADPLAPGPRKPLMSSTASSSSAGTPRLDITELAPSATSPKKGFLERYVRQQAHIEQMLNEWRPSSSSLNGGYSDSKGGFFGHQRRETALDMDENGQPLQLLDVFVRKAMLEWPLKVTGKTRSVSFDGNVMTCALKSGAARFTPPDEHTFRFCVRPQDPVETHPFYIGMVPAGQEVFEVNFLDRTEGIFLRVGGYPAGREAIDGPPLDDKDPLKPEFTVFGERLPAELPLPNPGGGVALHFFESFPRDIIVTEKVQCTGCKALMDTTEEFAEHVFEDADIEGHGDEFGFDCVRPVEVVDEGEYNFDPHGAKLHARFQVEHPGGRGKKAFAAEPHCHSLERGVPNLPRELPELVGGKTVFGPEGPWELCVFLTIPGTRVDISWLSAGRPLRAPKPTKIRPSTKKPEKAKKSDEAQCEPPS